MSGYIIKPTATVSDTVGCCHCLSKPRLTPYLRLAGLFLCLKDMSTIYAVASNVMYFTHYITLHYVTQRASYAKSGVPYAAVDVEPSE